MKILLTLASLLILSASAAAEPVRLVTSGFYSAIWEEEPLVDLIGSGFEIEGDASTLDSPLFRCHPCTAGDTIDLSSSLTGDSFNTVIATIDGIAYARLSLAGVMHFASGTIVVPDLPDPEPLGPAPQAVLTLPFIFTGMLTGFANADRSGDALFSSSFAGNGRAILTLINNPSFVGLYADQIEYQFQATDPVPEPATLTLLTIGITAAAASRHQTRRRRNGSARTRVLQHGLLCCLVGVSLVMFSGAA